MTIGADALSAEPVATDGAIQGFGDILVGPVFVFGAASASFRGKRYRANAVRTRFHARESDSSEMIGTFDKDPIEKVWVTFDFADLLGPATVTALVWTLDAGLVLLNQTILAREVSGLFAGAGSPGIDYVIKCRVVASDGSDRCRRVKVRSREL